MKRNFALQKAAEIAQAILVGMRKAGNCKFKDAPLLLALVPIITLLSDLEAGESVDRSIIDFRVYETLLFGSAADESKAEVGDIDLIIIDGGTLSPFFMPDDPAVTDTNKEHHEDDEDEDFEDPNASLGFFGLGDWYHELNENIRILLEGWLGYSEDEIAKILGDTKIDLHVLPLEMIKSKEKRTEIASKHKDPMFLINVFKKMMRYDRTSESFVPVDIPYFEKTYHTDLSDLKAA